ncbi:MAG: NAD(P)(+) transhydrogenase (Re/Si-specific) subunit beta, partial [Alphaproteobacteria bacterium]
MSANLINIAYLVSAICFILGLRGLASPESARTGNIIGMTGMAIAVVVTLMLPGITAFAWIIAGVAIGGGIGTFVALKVKITELPELVAIFNSLVGLAAVFISGAALPS